MFDCMHFQVPWPLAGLKLTDKEASASEIDKEKYEI
jgi:hypothetical protein